MYHIYYNDAVPVYIEMQFCWLVWPFPCRLKRKQRQKVKKREGKAGSEKSASSTAHGSGTEEGDEEGGEEGDEEGDEGGGGEAMASGGSDAEEEAHFVIGGK